MAENSFGICLESGIGIQPNLPLAARYYQRSAAHGDPDGANNLGFCFEHGGGVKQSIEQAVECYEFARDHGHPEGEINYHRCLRILGRWIPDRSSAISDRSSSDIAWAGLFTACLEHPQATDGAPEELLASIRRTKSEMEGRDRLTVKLDEDLRQNHPKVPRAVRLRELNHTLIAPFGAEQLTKSAPNGSLASHFVGAPNSEFCPLRGETRIAKIIAGVALAMRHVHSQGVIHCNLNPDSLLLDWDWTVKIGDFRFATVPGTQAVPPDVWAAFDCRYLAPECYDNRFLFKSDVFSFGLILYRLIVGRRPFSRLGPHGAAKRIAVDGARPRIPAFVLPDVRALICDCWAPDPDGRPRFPEIVNRLKKMRFRLQAGVNSAKVAAFVGEIEQQESGGGNSL
jgi:hypothetical protein